MVLIPHRPQSSTLFPYTTLFRSPEAAGPGRRHRRDGTGERHPAVLPAAGGERHRRVLLGHHRDQGPDPRREDRKSTRLNSSHGYISYAVFCLKKKNAIWYFTSIA